jgi:hypothetical protein
MASKKELIITLKTDLFADKHQLKIYKHDHNYALSEHKRVKKYMTMVLKL